MSDAGQANHLAQAFDAAIAAATEDHPFGTLARTSFISQDIINHWNERGCVRCYYNRLADAEKYFPQVDWSDDGSGFRISNPEALVWWKDWRREWHDPRMRRSDRYYCAKKHTTRDWCGAAISKLPGLDAGHLGWVLHIPWQQAFGALGDVIVGHLGSDEGRWMVVKDVQNTLMGENFIEWKRLYAEDANFEAAFIKMLQVIEYGYFIDNNNCNSSTYNILSDFGANGLPYSPGLIDMSWYHRIDREPKPVPPLPPLPSSEAAQLVDPLAMLRAAHSEFVQTVIAERRKITEPTSTKITSRDAYIQSKIEAISAVIRFNGKRRANQSEHLQALRPALCTMLVGKLRDAARERKFRIETNALSGQVGGKMPSIPVIDVDTGNEWVSLDWR